MGSGVGVGSVTATIKVPCPVPPVLAAERVIVKLPSAVGVPDRSPVSVSMESHAGRLAPEMVAL